MLDCAATALTVWAAAYRAGVVPADAALDVATGFGLTAGVRRGTADPAPAAGTALGAETPWQAAGSPAPALTSPLLAELPGPGEAAAGAAELLPLLRAGRPALLLPRPGDVRGVPAGPVGTAALAAGAGVALPAVPATLLPGDGQWRVFTGVGNLPVPDPVTARELLADAVHQATAVLTSADLGRDAATARREVFALQQQRAVPLPPAAAQRGVELLHRCGLVEAIVLVAADHGTSAVNLHQLRTADAALAPLADAARQAKLAAVDLIVGGYSG